MKHCETFLPKGTYFGAKVKENECVSAYHRRSPMQRDLRLTSWTPTPHSLTTWREPVESLECPAVLWGSGQEKPEICKIVHAKKVGPSSAC